MASGPNPGELTAADFNAPGDKRREERLAHRRMIQILPNFLDPEWKFLWAELINCSPNGLGLLVPQPLKIGQDFMVQLRMERVLLLLYSVRHCTQAEGGYRVGAQFTGLASDPVRRDPRAVLEALLAEGGTEGRK